MSDDRSATTDIDDWRAFLGRFGIPFAEATAPGEAIGFRGDGVATTLEITAKSAEQVVGYTGFAVDIEFDATGRFLRFGIWE
jgi:hypothetical protein